MRRKDFPEFKGTYDMAVSTYGNLGTWQNTDTIVFGIDFLKDMNDSIFICETKTKKITNYEKNNNLNTYFSLQLTFMQLM